MMGQHRKYVSIIDYFSGKNHIFSSKQNPPTVVFYVESSFVFTAVHI